LRARAQVIIIGAGFAGLSAALYLGRAKRDTLVIDSGKSMARWEPKVENYLGFPAGIHGEDLLKRGRRQADRFHVRFKRDHVTTAELRRHQFILRGRNSSYECECLLLATGIFHRPPEIPGVTSCLGHSMFFCKDCDGLRVENKRVAIYGWTNQTAEYALAMLAYTPLITIVTDGRKQQWDAFHERWMRHHEIPVLRHKITDVRRSGGKLSALVLKNGGRIPIEALFTTRGDLVFNQLAKCLGARLDPEGQVITDLLQRSSVKGLYAAGCVTTANCQMIIAAGQGATAAQAINSDLFKQTLRHPP
jgi:thioredoxin reductase (NADPH)